MPNVSSEHSSNYYCPLKKGSNFLNKNQCKPYTIQHILKSIAVKRLHRNVQYEIYNEEARTGEKVKRYKNNIVKLTRTSKANHYNNFFKENKLNFLKLWNEIREIINIRPMETNYATSLQFNDITIND